MDTDDELIPVLCPSHVGAVTDGLVAFVRQKGGEDNVTAVVVEIKGTEEERAVGISELGIIFGALEANFLFQELYLSRLSHVMNACRYQTYQTGQSVIEAGTHCEQMHIVAQGCVSLTREGSTPARIETGGVFGGTTLLNPRPCRATVKAETPTTLLIMTREAVTKLIRKDPCLGLAMMERLATVLSKMMDDSYIRKQGTGFDARGENPAAPNDLF